MKTRIILFLAAMVAPAVAGELVTISGDPADLKQVVLSSTECGKSIRVSLPTGGSLKIKNAVELSPAPAEGNRTVFTATFDEPVYTLYPAGRIVLTDAKPGADPASPATPVPRVAGATTPTPGSGNQPEAATGATPKKPAEDPDPVLAIAGAAVTLPKKGELAKRDFSFDASIPESPAAAVINSTAAIVRFSESKDATTQLLNIADGDGNIKTGFSFAFHPYRLWARPTLSDYAFGGGASKDEADGRWVRFFSRLDLSLAATVDSEPNAAGNRGATGALGLSGFIFNRADTRLRAAVALAKLAAPTPTGGLTITGSEGVNNAKVATSEQVTAIMKEISQSSWNDSYWAFGLAPRYRSETANFSGFRYDGGAAWTTLGYGFEDGGARLGMESLKDIAQVLLHASYRDRQTVDAPSLPGGSTRENALIYGAQLRVGGKNFNAFGEILWEKHRPQGLPHHSTETYYFGFEKKLKDDLWLQVALGSEEKPNTTGRSAFIRTALSYGFGDMLDPQEPRNK